MLSLFSQFIFGNSSLFSGKDGGSSSPSWKDRSLCFDMRPSDLELNQGELLIACFFPIEDIKGNPDSAGVLMVTNLRLIWVCCEKKRVNLSIGWRTVLLTFQQNHKDSLGSPITSLCVLTKYDSTKYEFVFNKLPAYRELWSGQDSYQALVQLNRFSKSFSISHLSPMYADEPCEVVLQVWYCYKRTNLFRQCRANLNNLLPTTSEMAQRSGIEIGQINKLEEEEVLEIYTNVVQSESRLAKHSGTLILSNIRLIWVDESLPMRNLSVPYIRIDTIKLKQSDKIVISTHDYLATSNQIEFRLAKGAESQVKRTKLVFEQIQNLCLLYKSKPKYGPESCDECINMMSNLKPIAHYFQSLDESIASQNIENFGPAYNGIYLLGADQNQVGLQNSEKKSTSSATDDNSEINDKELTNYKQKLNSYLNEQPIERDRDLIYSQDLGLTIERPLNDKELSSIWMIDL